MAAASPVSPNPSLPPAPPALADHLRRVPDPRDPRGKRHSLEAVLLLVVVASLSGRTHNQGIAEWGRGAPAVLQEALGFQNGRTPAPSTLHEVLKRVDTLALAREVRAWATTLLRYLDPTGATPIACDGKTVRGSLRAGAGIAHFLSVFSGSLGLTLDLEPADGPGGEITGAAPLLLRLQLKGRIVTLDALFTHQRLAETLVDAGADYVLPVKGNQPELLAELTWLFGERVPANWSPDVAESLDWEHGRREVRRLTLLEPPAAERLDWSHARQYYCLERTRRVQNRRGEVRTSVKRVYGITSLPRSQANAARLLQLIRGHWGIENRSHWIRDVVLREDESRVVTDNIVRALNGLRCAALTLLHRERCVSGARSVAATLRRLQQQPLTAARLVLEPV